MNEKGNKVWPYQVDKLILLLLVNGTKPSTILDNIILQAKLSL